MGFISDLITNVSAFRIKIGEKLLILKAAINLKANIDGSNIPPQTHWTNLHAGGLDGYVFHGSDVGSAFESVLVISQGAIFRTSKFGLQTWVGIGIMNDLTTTHKDDLVGAINEVNSNKANTTGNYPNLTVGNSKNWNGHTVNWAQANQNPVDVLGWDIVAQENRPIQLGVLKNWLSLGNYALLSQVYTKTQTDNLLASKLDINDLDGFIYDVQYNSTDHRITFYQQNESNIIIDLPIEQLIKGVSLVGNDLVFTFEDGSTVPVPMNTLLVGVVKSVNGLPPNSQGEIILNITDIPNLSSELNSKVSKSGDLMTGALRVGVNIAGKQRIFHLGEPTFTDHYGFDFLTNSDTGLLTIHSLNNDVRTATPSLSVSRINNRIGVNVENATAQLDVNGNVRVRNLASGIVRADAAGELVIDPNTYALASTIPTGQLTVNTTADLVGGYVYLPSGNVTTTLGLATHILNAIADGQTAYGYGNHATQGYLKIADLAPYETTISVNNKLTAKQDKLIAGANVSIVGNTISATDTDTVTRIGVWGGNYTSGDINFTATGAATIVKNGNNINIDVTNSGGIPNPGVEVLNFSPGSHVVDNQLTMTIVRCTSSGTYTFDLQPGKYDGDEICITTCGFEYNIGGELLSMCGTSGFGSSTASRWIWADQLAKWVQVG